MARNVEHESRLAIIAAIAGNIAIAITKFIAAGLRGSLAMLSEGIHSLVDTGNRWSHAARHTQESTSP
jgi:divalent metal cation (Fe/Co/Zn/Cd) transporter